MLAVKGDRVRALSHSGPLGHGHDGRALKVRAGGVWVLWDHGPREDGSRHNVGLSGAEFVPFVNVLEALTW